MGHIAEMDVAACVPQSDSAPGNRFINSVMISSSSCASGRDGDTLKHEEIDEIEDNFGEDAMPRDRESLEHEVARLDELERKLQLETATDFVLGCELLRATLRDQLAKAHAALKRRQTAAQRVCEYAGKKGRQTYVNRCAELQREMSADTERELRRLQTAKDGVSVTSRRRRAVRDETRGGFSTPAKKSANGMRRRRTIDGDDDGPEDVFLASASPEERAHRVQFQEKKRLERLLGRASVFKPAIKHVTPKEMAADLEAIRSAVPCDMKPPVAKPAKKKPGRPKKLKRRRPMIITPRRIPHASATSSNIMAAKNRRPRLGYNPRMLQEGQEVEVFKRQLTESVAGNDHESQDERVMSGTITAATATQVYVLTASGRFKSFDVRDCVLGLLYVRALESNNGPTDT